MLRAKRRFQKRHDDELDALTDEQLRRVIKDGYVEELCHPDNFNGIYGLQHKWRAQEILASRGATE